MSKYMRRLILLVLTLFSLDAFAQVITSAKPFELGFNSLSYTEYLGYVNQGGFSFTLESSNPIEVGDIVRLEIFDDFNLTVPVSFGAIGYSFDFTSPTDSFGATIINAFQSNQGGLRLTVLSGSIDLKSITAMAVIQGNQYQSEIFKSAVTSVPEPNKAALILIALIMLILKRKTIINQV